MQKDEKVQARLTQGSSVLVCMVDKHVKPGQSVTLKDGPEGYWNVDWVSAPVKASSIKSNRDYRVGGL